MRFPSLIALAILCFSAPAGAADQVECDLGAVRLKSAYDAGDFSRYLSSLADLRGRCPSLDPEIDWFEAMATLGTGDAVRAREMLLAYVNEQGRDGDHYAEALQTIVELESGAAVAPDGGVVRVPMRYVDGEPVGRIVAAEPDWFYVKYRLDAPADTAAGSLYVLHPETDVRIFLHRGKALDDGSYSAMPSQGVDAFGQVWMDPTIAGLMEEHQRILAAWDDARRDAPARQQAQSGGGNMFSKMLGAAVDAKISDELGGSNAGQLGSLFDSQAEQQEQQGEQAPNAAPAGVLSYGEERKWRSRADAVSVPARRSHLRMLVRMAGAGAVVYRSADLTRIEDDGVEDPSDAL